MRPEASELIDPTASGELVSLLGRVQDHLKAQDRFERLNARTTAVVLAGGGGKGAYEAGVILALWDSGIRQFVAIAGTSVGALNAALFKRLLQTGDRSIVLQVWSDMNVGKVLTWNPWSILKLLLYLPVSVLAFHQFERLVNQIRPKHYYRPSLPSLLNGMLFAALLVVAALIGFYCLYAFTKLIAHLQAGLNLTTHTTIVIFLILAYFVPTSCRWLGKRLGIADNRPLRQTVCSVFDTNLLRGDPELICTLAAAPYRYSRYRYPQYPTFSKLADARKAVDLLIQSAALPEIFPMKNIFGNACVDGGLEDNVPIYGVYPIQPSRLIAVYLDDGYRKMLQESEELNIGWVPNGNHTKWNKVAALRIWENSRLAKIAQRRQEEWDGARRDWFSKLELFPIIPSEDLGGLFAGTLNFCTSKSQKLMALGYTDTLTALLTWEPSGASA